ncbi:MAG: hypothetical protein S4CHLAM37_12230 [Chlamydiia bacterium]|nr:hypothetical protein [Chlamydiia bacterium]
MAGHAGTQVTAVSSVGGTSHGKIQAMSEQQVLQDLQELLKLLEGTKKANGKDTKEKLIEQIVKNIEHNLHAHPSAFGAEVTGKLDHLCKITTENIQKISEYLDNPDAAQNSNNATQVNLVTNLNTSNETNGVEGVHLDTTQNTTNYFDPHKYHTLLTSIQDQINNPTLY